MEQAEIPYLREIRMLSLAALISSASYVAVNHEEIGKKIGELCAEIVYVVQNRPLQYPAYTNMGQ